VFVAVGLAALSACSSSSATGGPAPSAYYGTPGSSAGSAGGSPSASSAMGSAPPLLNGAAAGTGDSTPRRAIQEADIYKLAGNTLYILNSYRGLQIVDVSNLQSPQLLARVPVVGAPRDIYVEGNTAYVLVSDAFDFDCGGYHGRCGWEALPGITTQIVSIDVTNPATPSILGETQINGDLQDSRIVGKILYVVSTAWSWQQWNPSEKGHTYVASFDVSNPHSFQKVDQQDYPWSQWDVGIYTNVTDTRVILAEAGDTCDLMSGNNCSEDTPVTQFLPIDITDPGGHLTIGKPFLGNGIVLDRWAMDFDPKTNVFRAVLSNDWNGTPGGGELVDWDAPTVQSATQLASLPIAFGDHVSAVAFDGPRAYLSTAHCTDPISIVDTTNPASPQLRGSVAMPGAMDFLLPQGDRLIGLGHADPSCTAFEGHGQLEVTLFDVTDAAKPTLLSSVNFGGQGGFVAASRSDLKKAFLVLPEQGLVLVPYQNRDWTTYQAIGGTQLIDLGPSTLTLRGMAPQQGLVERAFPVQNDLVAFSDQKLQVLDIANRDAPAVVAQLDLARPVLGLGVVSGYAVELSGDPAVGDAEVAVTAAASPDQPVPVATVPVPAPAAQSFQDGSILWLLASDTMANTAWLQAIDAGNPASTVMRGKLSLDPSLVPVARAASFQFGQGDEALLASHALILHRAWAAYLQVVDLTDPDAPTLAKPIPCAASSWGLMAAGSDVLISDIRGGQLQRLDLTMPSAPSSRPLLGMPGVVVAASADGSTLYAQNDRTLFEVTLQSGAATTGRSVQLQGQPVGAALDGGFLYAVTTTGNLDQVTAVDLSTFQAASTLTFGAQWSKVLAASGDKLFVQVGWNDTAVMVFDLAVPGTPALQGVVRTDDFVANVIVSAGSAYVLGGYHGAPRIDLTPGSPLVLGL
jgi:hypothetical protein